MTKFDVLKLPRAALAAAAVSAVVAGVVLLAMPSSVGSASLRAFAAAAAADALPRFELTDALNAGRFRRTARAADTAPDEEAAYFALALSAAAGVRPPAAIFAHSERLSRHVSARLRAGNLSLDALHNVLAAARFLRVEGSDPSSVDAAGKVALHATPAGYSLAANGGEGSVAGAFYAAMLLAAEKQIDRAKAVEIRRQLFAHQAPLSGGFRDVLGGEPSMLATWRAVRVLGMLANMEEGAAPDADDLAATARSVEKALVFLSICRAADGGFHAIPVSRRSPEFSQPSPAASTAQGLYVLGIASRFGIDAGKLSGEATEYIEACWARSTGVTEHATSATPSLEAAYYVLELHRLSPVALGSKHYFRPNAQWTASLLFCVAAAAWFGEQMNPSLLRVLFRHSVALLVLLSASVTVLIHWPSFAVFAYLAALVALAQIFYNSSLFVRSASDGSPKELVYVESFLFLGLAVGLRAAAPQVFVRQSVFHVLALWAFFTPFVSSYGVGHFIRRRTARFHMAAATAAWSLSMVGLALLLGMRDVSLVYRLLTFRGQRVAILVLLPVVYFALFHLGAGLGSAMFAGPLFDAQRFKALGEKLFSVRTGGKSRAKGKHH